MMSIMTMTLMTTISLCLFTINPVKMSVLIMTLSGFYFFFLSEQTGTMWFPLLYSLLFMGGILIMFLILSSLSPNEKTMKSKISTTMIALTMTIPNMIMNHNPLEMSFFMKWFMKSSTNLQMMMMIMVTYFLAFMYMITKEETPLRSLSCLKSMIL